MYFFGQQVSRLIQLLFLLDLQIILKRIAKQKQCIKRQCTMDWVLSGKGVSRSAHLHSQISHTQFNEL